MLKTRLKKEGSELIDPLHLAWRDFITQTIREVITQPELDPLSNIQRSVAERIPGHEGVLARYGLRPSAYAAWKALHGH